MLTASCCLVSTPETVPPAGITTLLIIAKGVWSLASNSAPAGNVISRSVLLVIDVVPYEALTNRPT